MFYRDYQSRNVVPLCMSFSRREMVPETVFRTSTETNRIRETGKDLVEDRSELGVQVGPPISHLEWIPTLDS